MYIFCSPEAWTEKFFQSCYFNTLDKAIIFAIDDIKHAQLRIGLRLLLAKIIHF